MTQLETPAEAWAALEREDFERASQIWTAVSVQVADREGWLACELGQIFVLIVQNHLRAANHLLRELHAQTGSATALHLIGWLDAETGRGTLARMHFLAEQAHLAPEDYLAWALNAHELGLLAWREQESQSAAHYAGLSLEYALLAQSAKAEQCARLLQGLVRGANPSDAPDMPELRFSPPEDIRLLAALLRWRKLAGAATPVCLGMPAAVET